MKTYPLLFRFSSVVRKGGFAAVVIVTNGQAVMEELDGSWWINGVQPGGIAESGAAPVEVYQRFREAFQRVLETFCKDAPDSAAFEAEIRKFFKDIDRPARKQWIEARQRIRAGEQVPLDLKRDTSEAAPTVEVLKLHKSMPVRDDSHAIAA